METVDNRSRNIHAHSFNVFLYEPLTQPRPADVCPHDICVVRLKNKLYIIFLLHQRNYHITEYVIFVIPGSSLLCTTYDRHTYAYNNYSSFHRF